MNKIVFALAATMLVGSAGLARSAEVADRAPERRTRQVQREVVATPLTAVGLNNTQVQGDELVGSLDAANLSTRRTFGGDALADNGRSVFTILRPSGMALQGMSLDLDAGLRSGAAINNGLGLGVRQGLSFQSTMDDARDSESARPSYRRNQLQFEPVFLISTPENK